MTNFTRFVSVTHVPCNPGHTLYTFMHSCILILPCVRINDDNDDDIQLVLSRLILKLITAL